MTTSHDDPAHLVATFVAAFNDGDAALLEHAYEPQGVLIPRPGFPVTGPQRSAANAYLLDMGLPMDARLRHVYVAGNIALLIVDWSLRGTASDGTASDGTAVDLHGTATDVVRRGADGAWRYVIDNPFGTALPT